jgi:hypothetical protein
VNIDYSKKKFNKIQINVLKIKIDDSIVWKIGDNF